MAQRVSPRPRQEERAVLSSMPASHRPGSGLDRTSLHHGVQNGHQDELRSLQESHVALSRRMQRLDDMMLHSKRLLDAERMSTVTHLQTREDTSLSRTILFARIRASKVLHLPSSVFGRREIMQTAGNSIVPHVLKSPGTDCTLQDFQELALRLLADPSTHCHSVPSEYHVKFPSICLCAKLSIVFDTYADLCQALQLDISTREEAVYREKGNHARQVRAIQVLGSLVSDSTSRSILLGRRAPLRAEEGFVRTVYQESTEWIEGTWVSGFTYRDQPISSFLSPMRATVMHGSSISPVPHRASSSTSAQDFSKSSPLVSTSKRARCKPISPPCFSLTWERMDGADCTIASAGSIPESLRSHFPAVVVRTNVLLRSIHEIFKTRVNGANLTTLLSTPSPET